MSGADQAAGQLAADIAQTDKADLHWQDPGILDRIAGPLTTAEIVRTPAVSRTRWHWEPSAPMSALPSLQRPLALRFVSGTSL
jgi:hypothetical protein